MDTSLVAEYTQEAIDYDENPDFNQDIDERVSVQYSLRDGCIEIASSSMRPSEILYKVDYVAYHTALVDFRQDEIENFKEVVFTEFPTPIAFNFERFERGYENQHQRLLLLRDTWEAIIFLLYALIIGEFRSIGLSMEETKIKSKQLVSDSLADRLSVIEQLVQLAIDKSYKLSCLDYISIDVVEKLRELNRVRNEFSHSSAKSTEQSSQLISKYQGYLISVLRDIREINNVEIIRYFSQQGNCLSFRHEKYKGCSLNRKLENKTITKEKFNQICDYLNNTNILAVYDEKIYCLSPFQHFKSEATGNHPRLCFYKKKKSNSSELIYEVLDGSGEIEIEEKDLSKNDFNSAIDEIKALLPDLSGATRGGS